MRAMQYHRISAVCTHQQPRIFVLLIKIIAAAFILPHPLDDIPNFSAHQCRVGILKDQALLSGMLDSPLILVGFCAVSHVDSVAQIHLIFQDYPDRVSAPMVRLIQIQPGMGDAIFAIRISCRTQDLFRLQFLRNGACPACGGSCDTSSTRPHAPSRIAPACPST